MPVTESAHPVSSNRKEEAASYQRSTIAFYTGNMVTSVDHGFALMKLNNSMFYN